MRLLVITALVTTYMCYANGEQCPDSGLPVNASTRCCGIDSSEGSRLLGGNQIAIDEHPWLALIEYKSKDKIKTLCGGTLISPRYVLTAAHCVVNALKFDNTPVNVRLGEYDTTHEGPDCVDAQAGSQDCNGGTTVIPIEKTIAHPEYKVNRKIKDYDIALIRLAKPAPYTDFIRPICLPSSATPRSDQLWVAGWGAYEAGRRNSDTKGKAQVPLVNHAECQTVYNPRHVTISDKHICAGGTPARDTCKADAGGPLMSQNKGQYEIVGVISFGPTVCSNIPEVFTRVYEYDSWIRSVMVA